MRLNDFVQYSAPEVLRGERYTEKCDVFSFGIMVWETFTEKIPYDGWAPLKIASDVAYHQRRPELPDNLIPNVKTIITDSWGEDAEKRSLPPQYVFTHFLKVKLRCNDPFEDASQYFMRESLMYLFLTVLSPQTWFR